VNRRDALRLGAAATAGTLAGGRVWGQGRGERVLILGGTGFIGPHIVRACREHGHTVTLFNRGKRNPACFRTSWLIFAMRCRVN
jgi:2'-hydroxyisoflavone reductase